MIRINHDSWSIIETLTTSTQRIKKRKDFAVMNISESRPISQHYRVIDSDYDIILLVTPNDNVVKPED